MIILSIETSADETAVSIVEVSGTAPDVHFSILGDALSSQMKAHREYGGIFPNLAKREHARALVPLLEKALDEAKLETAPGTSLFPEQKEELATLLEREPELADNLLTFFDTHEKPAIDAIAVTSGPGLEPALWVGINFAKALAHIWNIPLVPVNHMEGHILIGLLKEKKERQFELAPLHFPALALLVSGGHTELVLMRGWNEYEVIGETRDDAAGEAFDKVARMLDLPYPGGPEISKRAEEAREKDVVPTLELPRPMLHSDDCDFSFSGLKTAVLYYVKDKKLTPELIQELTLEFENAVTEVLVTKTKKAIEEYGAKTLILGGGVAANTHLRRSFEEMQKDEYPELLLYLPDKKLTTDNSVMIALAGYFETRSKKEQPAPELIVAEGKRRL